MCIGPILIPNARSVFFSQILQDKTITCCTPALEEKSPFAKRHLQDLFPKYSAMLKHKYHENRLHCQVFAVSSWIQEALNQTITFLQLWVQVLLKGWDFGQWFLLAMFLTCTFCRESPLISSILCLTNRKSEMKQPVLEGWWR